MRKVSSLIGAICICSAGTLLSCAGTQRTNRNQQQMPAITTRDTLNIAVEEAAEWTNLFRRQSGWFGGDGIFSTRQNGVETPANEKEGSDSTASPIIFWFSDSMIGEIKDSLQPGAEMINNAAAILRSGKPDTTQIRFVWDTASAKNRSLFVPRTSAAKEGEYYWLGDGFVNHEQNNELVIFAYRMRNTGEAVFGFREVGNTLIIVPSNKTSGGLSSSQIALSGSSKAGASSTSPSSTSPSSTPHYIFDFSNYREVEIPFFAGKASDTTGTIGAGIYVNTREAGAPQPDGYVYIYGLKGKDKRLIVARVKPADITKFSSWTFYNGKQWVSQVAQAIAIAPNASNEMGVVPVGDGRYALIFHEKNLGRHVQMRLGPSPIGPFGPVINVWDCGKDVALNDKMISYNSKPHPVLSRPGEIIISYNINSLDFGNDLKRYPDFYRPRFIRLKLKP